MQSLFFKKFQLPFLLQEVEYINNAFGSGVAEFFKQMRWLMVVNLVTFILWLGLVIFPWLVETPLNEAYAGWNPSVTPRDKSWWHRDDLGWNTITRALGKDSYEVFSSWIYYSGYPDSDKWIFSDTDDPDERYYMDAAYCTCLIGTFILFFLGVFYRMQRNFRLRKVTLLFSIQYSVSIGVAD